MASSWTLSTIKYIKCIIGSAEGAFAASEALLHMSTRSEITECMDVSTPFSCHTIRHNVPFQHGIPKKNRVSRNFEEHKKGNRV